MDSVRIEIPKYLRSVKISNARAKKYYEFTKKHPKAKKYQDKEKYSWKKIKGFGDRLFLVDLETNERVVANPKAAGTEGWEVINGQKIYSANCGLFTRNKIIKAIKDQFVEFYPIEERFKVPVVIRCELYDTIETKGQLWDLDNRSWPYFKAGQDLMVSLGMLEDDSVIYITGTGGTRFKPIKEGEDPKMVFIIEPEDDEEVLKSIKDYELRKLPK